MVTPGLKANVKFSWDAYNAHTLNRIVTPSTYYATGRDEEGNLDFVRSTEGSDYMKLTRTNSGTRTINLKPQPITTASLEKSTVLEPCFFLVCVTIQTISRVIM